LAECDEPHAIARGLSPQNPLDKLRDEIRYRIELCPCTGVEDDFVQLEVIAASCSPCASEQLVVQTERVVLKSGAP
jgi:hypothetical protein